MGRRGPPKKTTAENKLNGFPGKRAVNREEPEYEAPTIDAFTCPPEIKGAGRREWESIGPMLIETGVLKKPDMPTFRNYCRTLSDIETYENKLLEVPDGLLNLRSHMYIQHMIMKLRTQSRHFAQDCGVTPASRSAVKGTPKRQKSDETQAPKTSKPETPQIPGSAQAPGSNVSRFFKRKA